VRRRYLAPALGQLGTGGHAKSLLPPASLLSTHSLRLKATGDLFTTMAYVFAMASLVVGPLLLTALVIPLVKRLAWGLNLVDHPAAADHKSHRRPTPYGGGIAIFLGTLLPVVLVLLYILRLLAVSGTHTFPSWMPATALFFAGINQISILLGCASMLLLIGLIDDWRGLPPLPRFLIEIATAAILVFEVPEFRLVFLTDHASVAVPLTVFWIVSMTNAFNFLDNMDGLTAGMAAIILVLLAFMALNGNHLPAAVVSLVLVGAISGFLLYNFPPASVFMGDAGGLFLGFMAGSLSALLSHNLSQAGAAMPHPLAPLVILIVPAYDLVSVVLIRLGNGVPLWIGDNNHISHRLVHLGLSRRQAVLVIYSLTLLTGLPALFLLQTHSWVAWLLLFLAPVFSFTMALFDLAARRRRLPP
jgi:UDP-GlcNAc:undecaprenyl-phosphate GlcNAc-1-phosphate transferase